MIPTLPVTDRLREFTTEQLKQVSTGLEALAREVLTREVPDRLLGHLLIDLYLESRKELLCRSFPNENRRAVLAVLNQKMTN